MPRRVTPEDIIVKVEEALKVLDDIQWAVDNELYGVAIAAAYQLKGIAEEILGLTERLKQQQLKAEKLKELLKKLNGK